MSCRLQHEFDFTPSQARYLSVNCFGYCRDILKQLDDIHKSAELIRRVLENYGLN